MATLVAAVACAPSPAPASRVVTEVAPLAPALAPATAAARSSSDDAALRRAQAERDAFYGLLDTSLAPPPPLPRGTKVLVIGDSMAQALGMSLNRRFKDRGIHAYMAAKAGTFLPDFAGPKMKLRFPLAYHDPDLVVVSLGGNDTGVIDPNLRVWAVERLVEKIGDRPCIWVATPLWPGVENTGILEVIRKHCAPCKYVDTNALIPDMDRIDGIHPTWPERERWADLMIRWLLHNRVPDAERPFELHEPPEAPPPGSEAWLEVR